MGDPRRIKKKWSKPLHPWQEARMAVETELLIAYGLQRKKEIWKMNAKLKKYFEQAKGLIGSVKATDADKVAFVSKLIGLGLLKDGSKLDDALNIGLKDLMERRLQTIVARERSLTLHTWSASRKNHSRNTRMIPISGKRARPRLR